MTLKQAKNEDNTHIVNEKNTTQLVIQTILGISNGYRHLLSN